MVSNTYKTWLEIIFGTTQSSTLGALVIKISLADLLFISNDVDIANSAVNNTS